MKNKLPEGEYIVKLYVTLSGDVIVKAKTKKEAMEKIEKRLFFPKELYDFHQIDSRVLEARCIS